MTKHLSKAGLFEKAFQNGFDAIGIASPDVFYEEIEHYNEYLSRNFHGEIQYLARNIDLRTDVSRILPSVKSVIAVAINYYNDTDYSNIDLKISRYALGVDYHRTVKNKLDELADFIKKYEPSAETKCLVDSGSALEKHWAVRAGIGWQGKNSLVISKKNGSWFFIGLILTNIEFEPDKPIADFCGECTLCIDTCPTGAIVSPKIVDARKCISYWTIETKPEKEIPPEIAEKNPGWIYGCDICQEVCPWNEKLQTETKEMAFKLSLNILSLDERKILSLTEKEFSQIFHNSPVMRIKLDGLKRNCRSFKKI